MPELKNQDRYTPTPRLRWVKRQVPVPGHPNCAQAKHFLQQKWVSSIVGEEPEWRDVPTEPELST